MHFRCIFVVLEASQGIRYNECSPETLIAISCCGLSCQENRKIYALNAELCSKQFGNLPDIRKVAARCNYGDLRRALSLGWLMSFIFGHAAVTVVKTHHVVCCGACGLRKARIVWTQNRYGKNRLTIILAPVPATLPQKLK